MRNDVFEGGILSSYWLSLDLCYRVPLGSLVVILCVGYSVDIRYSEPMTQPIALKAILIVISSTCILNSVFFHLTCYIINGVIS